jgi:hypothetical protein
MTSETVLLRQIHPHHVQDDFVSSVTFRPNDGDQGQMSVYDGDLIEAEASFEHYTTKLGKTACGTVGLTVAECSEQKLEARPDPEPFPEHALIDFRGVLEKQWRAISKKLQAKARARGWLRCPSPG